MKKQKHHSALLQPSLLSGEQPITIYSHNTEDRAKAAALSYIDSLPADAPTNEQEVDIRARAYLQIAIDNLNLPGGQVLTYDFCRYEATFVAAYLQATQEAYYSRRKAKHKDQQARVIAERPITLRMSTDGYDRELLTLLDQAVEQARSLGRPFTDEEAMQAIWEAGYDIGPQSDPLARFVLCREAHGNQKRLWVVAE